MKYFGGSFLHQIKTVTCRCWSRWLMSLRPKTSSGCMNYQAWFPSISWHQTFRQRWMKSLIFNPRVIFILRDNDNKLPCKHSWFTLPIGRENWNRIVEHVLLCPWHYHGILKLHRRFIKTYWTLLSELNSHRKMFVWRNVRVEHSRIKFPVDAGSFVEFISVYATINPAPACSDFNSCLTTISTQKRKRD